jgi:hypothetical protein
MDTSHTNIPGPDETIAELPEAADDVLAWEEIAAGRYMPRRIRGSLRGRVLG